MEEQAILLKRLWNARRFRALILVLAALALVECGGIVAYGRFAPTHKADLAIVLGNHVDADGTPCARLAARLDRARTLYEAGLCKAILVSGGRGKNGVDEACAMESWLARRGVPEEHIYTDFDGIDSRHTAENAVNIMAEHQLQSAIVVTQYWHIARTVLACRQAGIATVSSAWPRFNEARDLYSIVREMVALPAYVLRLK